MPNKSEIERIAAKLSPAQRRAMSKGAHGPNHVWTWNAQGFEALTSRGLAVREYGNTGRLTPLGIEVRASLQDQS